MRLEDLTQAVRSRGEKAVVAFFTAGFPDEDTSLEILRAASRAGCPVIEVGVPFSDPIADGPVIQESSRRALENGMSLQKALDLTARASETVSAALVIMSYVNPILRMGIGRFADRAQASGVSGVIIPDVPFEESAEIRAALRERRLTLVDLVAPTSNGARVETLAAHAEGFLYLVSVTGVTGVRASSAADLGEFVARVRGRCRLPLYVGFGVSTPEQAMNATRHADGVIVGSALIRIAQSAPTREEAVEKVSRFLQEMNRTVNNSARRG